MSEDDTFAPDPDGHTKGMFRKSVSASRPLAGLLGESAPSHASGKNMPAKKIGPPHQ